MKKSILIKITALALALSFVIPSAYALYPAQRVEAQAQGKAVACVVGLLAAVGVSVPGFLKEVIGVSSGTGNTGNQLNTNASTNAISFNSCILQPLAKIMIVSLIRNIGASVVTWVNSGFNGSPTFVTDFGATVLDAADQAVGTFIEGSELGFLCNDFSFKIRIALALKYSQPFRQRAQCTLTDIANNVSTNGGNGWDNWLQVTTEPQNNIYGAYVIAESELAQRAFRAVDIKEKRIAIGQGFLDFETCDDPESQAEADQRNHFNDLKGDGSGSAVQVTTTHVGADSFGTYDLSGKQTSAPTTNTSTKTVFTNSEKPICKKMTTKTPGSVIAGKLNSTFAQGDIQAAVAQEIDDVIAATMNQLAQKVIMGSQGLLGLSKKRSNTQSYYNRYQNQYYGSGGSANTGATSPLEDYQVKDYNTAADLVNGDQQVQDIYKSTNVAANQAVAQQQAQQEAIDNTLNGGAGSEQNFALLKPASESSYGVGAASNAVNGVKDGAITQYNQPAGTAEEQNPWWEVDLGSAKAIKEVRIWKVTGKPDSQTLGIIHVKATDGASQNVWTSDAITSTQAGPNPIIVPVGQTRRYVRIEKQGILDQQCRVTYEFRGETQYASCYHPLELAEVEVIGTPVNPAGSIIGNTIASSTNPASATPIDDGKTATSTVSWTVAKPAGTISSGSPLAYELRLIERKPIAVGNELTIRSTLKKNGDAIPFLSIFSSFDFSFGRETEGKSLYSIAAGSDSGKFALTNVTNSDPSHYYLFKQSGVKDSNAMPGTYSLETTVEDKYGTILQTQTSNLSVQ